MKLCVECKFRLVAGLVDPCRKCSPFFPKKPEFVLHPDLQDNKWTVYKTGLKGGLIQ